MKINDPTISTKKNLNRFPHCSFERDSSVDLIPICKTLHRTGLPLPARPVHPFSQLALAIEAIKASRARSINFYLARAAWESYVGFFLFSPHRSNRQSTLSAMVRFASKIAARKEFNYSSAINLQTLTTFCKRDAW